MAGAAAPGELAATLRTRFAVATEGDDDAIRCLLRENPMRGAVSLTLEREPGYFAGANLAGGDDQTIVAFSGSRLVCMGRCARRDCWVNGEVVRVGYLAELRLDSATRGRFSILRDGYRFFHSVQSDDPSDLYFTSIAADNTRARALLETGVRGLPTYGFLAELDTLVVAVRRRSVSRMVRVEAATPARIPALVHVLNTHARRHQFAAVWTRERVTALEQQGLPLERFLVALDGDEVLACGALWDQRNFRQTVIRGYSPLLSVARPWINLVSGLLGTPSLPRVGSVLRHAFLSPLAFADGVEAMLPDFVESFFPLAAHAGVEFLTLALPASDSRLPELRRRFSTRTWRSRLYRVDWPEETSVMLRAQGTEFLPDVALL